MIRRYLCGHPDPFRSVRDLGRVPARCSRQSGEPECRPSAWLPAWLPAAHDAGHRDALVLVTDIGPSTGEGIAPCPDPAFCQPEKRKVDSSILSLTTSFGQVSSALISANADPTLSYPQPSSDHDYPCVTVVGRSLSHADRTSHRRASGSRPLRPELQAVLGDWLSAQLASAVHGCTSWRLSGARCRLLCCTAVHFCQAGCRPRW